MLACMPEKFWQSLKSTWKTFWKHENQPVMFQIWASLANNNDKQKGEIDSPILFFLACSHKILKPHLLDTSLNSHHTTQRLLLFWTNDACLCCRTRAGRGCRGPWQEGPPPQISRVRRSRKISTALWFSLYHHSFALTILASMFFYLKAL